MSLDLHFSSKSIHGLEKLNNTPIAGLIGNSTLGVLVQFIKAGKNLRNDDEALDVIDNCRKEGTSTTALQVEIIELLEEQGFLEKEMGLSQKIKAQIKKVGEMSGLDVTGQTTSGTL